MEVSLFKLGFIKQSKIDIYTIKYTGNIMLDFFKDLITSIRATSLDRIKNPFIGAFCFSWVTVNFKSILVLLFSEKTIEDKLIWIDGYNNLYQHLLYPLILSFTILAILPLISVVIMWVQDKPLSYVMSQYVKRDAETFKRKLETEKLRAQASVMFKRVVADEELVIQNLHNEIAESKNESAKLSSEIQRLEVERDSIMSELNNSKARIEQDKINAEMLIKSSLDLEQANKIIWEYKGEVSRLLSNEAQNEKEIIELMQYKERFNSLAYKLKNKYPNLFKSEIGDNVGGEVVNESFWDGKINR